MPNLNEFHIDALALTQVAALDVNMCTANANFIIECVINYQ
jgi:hypothetical protein